MRHPTDRVRSLSRRQLEWYSPRQSTTANGRLVQTLEKMPSHGLEYEGASLQVRPTPTGLLLGALLTLSSIQSWNKFVGRPFVTLASPLAFAHSLIPPRPTSSLPLLSCTSVSRCAVAN